MSYTYGYNIYGYDINIFCKITEQNIEKDNYKCIMSFGNKNTFCLTAIYNATNPYEIYIDNINYNDKCVINGTLAESGGIEKLVKIALWHMTKIYPHVLKYTFMDDSHIYCEKKSKLYKLNLAYDYILKYNKTWYQSKFKAELPQDLMINFNKSLQELDKPLDNYDFIIQKFNQFINFKNEYIQSKTPRDFINEIRTQNKDKYCFIVAKWLTQYMIYLQIKLYNDNWFISKNNIDSIPNYKPIKINNIFSNLIHGGNKTRKNKNFRLASYKNISNIGFYTSLK
jgi:hypothetical protein